MNKDTGLTQIKELLRYNGPKALMQDVAGPDENIKNWLARLNLLGDIPFQNLIGDERLLPKNSLRFFYLDPNWLNALTDGALSIGTNTTLDDAITAVMADSIRAEVSATANKLRAKLLGIGEAGDAPAPASNKPMAGMLLRSELVSAFPGLKIIPKYGAGQNPDQIPKRYEKLTDDLFIVIFPVVPESIKIQQPPQGLQFGFIDEGDRKPFKIKLRNIGDANTGSEVYKDGKPVEVAIEETDLLRPDVVQPHHLLPPDRKYVLNVNALKAAVQKSLEAAKAYPLPAEPIIPSQFVMQLINAPVEAIYKNPTI